MKKSRKRETNKSPSTSQPKGIPGFSPSEQKKIFRPLSTGMKDLDRFLRQHRVPKESLIQLDLTHSLASSLVENQTHDKAVALFLIDVLVHAETRGEKSVYLYPTDPQNLRAREGDIRTSNHWDSSFASLGELNTKLRTQFEAPFPPDIISVVALDLPFQPVPWNQVMANSLQEPPLCQHLASNSTRPLQLKSHGTESSDKGQNPERDVRQEEFRQWLDFYSRQCQQQGISLWLGFTSGHYMESQTGQFYQHLRPLLYAHCPYSLQLDLPVALTDSQRRNGDIQKAYWPISLYQFGSLLGTVHIPLSSLKNLD